MGLASLCSLTATHREPFPLSLAAGPLPKTDSNGVAVAGHI